MKKIEFIYIGKYAYECHDKPQPTQKYLPQWFINQTPYQISEDNPDGNKIKIKNRMSNATFKKCVPLLDQMSCGYVVSLWTDILIEKDKDKIEINWRVDDDVFIQHGKSSSNIPPPYGYDNVVFKYLTKFKIKTPKGYSVLIKPLFGYNSLPFYPISAIIDTDKSVIDNNIPCWIRNDVNGIIEKGTPIAQIIPFKRDNWQMSCSMINEIDHVINEDIGFHSTIKNNYIKNIWSRKIFR